MTSEYSAMHPHRKHTQFASESAESYAITHDLRNLRTLQSPPISDHTRLVRDSANNLANSPHRSIPPNRSRHQRHPHPADEYPPKHTRSSHNRQPNSRTVRPAPSSPDSSASTGQYDPQSPDAWKTSEKNLPQKTDSQSSSQQPTAYQQSSASASPQRRSKSYSMRTRAPPDLP